MSLLLRVQPELGCCCDGWSVSTSDASLPGVSLSPLDALPFLSPWDSMPVTYDPTEHLNQVDADGEDLKISALPFSMSPLNFLPWLSKLPRTDVAKFGLNLCQYLLCLSIVSILTSESRWTVPPAIKTSIFAAYPLYIPIFLAEFTDIASEERNVTCVAFATSESPVRHSRLSSV